MNHAFWSGDELGAIAFFQMMGLVTGLRIYYGNWKLTALILSLGIGDLVLIGLPGETALRPFRHTLTPRDKSF